jgi:hypothetical protein
MNIEKPWREFLNTLAEHEQQTLTRAQNGEPKHLCMPPQEVLEELQNKCLDLTNLWHGKSNCSAVYSSFLNMCELAGVSAYKYADLPIIASEDGYLSILNKDFRSSFIFKCDNPFSPELLAIRRTLPFNWQRNLALEMTSPDGKKITLRSPGAEVSKFCVNTISYQPRHGLGVAEHSDNIVCDIEKVAQEAEFINPYQTNNLLPGEIFFNVGQNSHTGSSVPFISHSHHSSETFDKFKLYLKSSNKPVALKQLDASCDVIQIGAKHDAFLVKIKSKSVTTSEYLNFCIGLRLQLELAFGVKVVDLYFHIIPTGDGEFYTITAPFCKLTKHVSADNKIMFINPETGENNVEQQVAQHLHLGNAAKCWEVPFSNTSMLNACVKNGEQRLRALYDFTAKKGTREVVQAYINNFIAL